MKVVDSSVWLEVATKGELATRCLPHLEDLRCVATPTVVMFEAYRALRRRGVEPAAMGLVGEMEFTRLVPVDTSVAIAAADLSLDHGLAAVDAMVYATARLLGCDLVTLDAHFRGLPGVVLIEAEA